MIRSAPAAIATRANPEQQRAILTTDGPLLIIAGPGSGKTFTLVERVVHLITAKGAAPESLLVATFTDKAAAELTTRISNRLNELGIRFNLNEMYLGTFHSICLRWLDDHRDFTRLKRSYTMMDQFDQQYFLYRHLAAFDEIEGIELIAGKADGSGWRRSKELLKWVNYTSEEALEAERLMTAEEPAVRALGHCRALYQRLIEEANAIDFSTIQSEALALLRARPDVRDRLRAQIDYLMVDEYQDTNTVQDLILTELAGERPNLCVVGDDDQGLYRFRGATIRNILQFAERFPEGDCTRVALTVNYRSHPDIIAFYNRWIGDKDWRADGVAYRFDKEIVPREADFPDSRTVVRVTAGDDASFHEEVLAFLHALRNDGQLTDWNQVAFLFRSVKNEKVVALAEFLEANGVPVYAPRSNQFFEREEVRLMLGALIFLFPQFVEVRRWSEDAHLDMWAYYDERCFRPFTEALREPENADLLRWARGVAKRHLHLVENTDYAFSGLFYQLLRFPLFSRYLDVEDMTGGVADARAMRNLAVFSQILNKFEYLHHVNVLSAEFIELNLRALFNQFLRYLEDGGINEYEDDAEYAPSGCVSFLTIHQAKGLEFPVVIVGSLDAVPRKQHSDLDALMEAKYLHRPPFEPLDKTKMFDFWRLYYTAFSRAQNVLALAYRAKSDGYGKSPSAYFKPWVEAVPTWRDPSFRLADIPLAAVKDVNLKQTYSFTSHLAVFENCAEQYRFFRALEFAPARTSPILFGTLVHQTIEDIHKAVLRGEEAQLSDTQVEAWFDTNYAYLTKRERVYLAPAVKRIALDHVLRYYGRHAGHWSHIREAEVDVSLVKDEYILTGTIDLIAGRGNTVELVDFKSERKLDVNDPADRPKLERYRRQLEVYAHIVEERYGLEVSRTSTIRASRAATRASPSARTPGRSARRSPPSTPS